MQYTNKLITFAVICSIYTPVSFSCKGCDDALKAKCDNANSAVTTKTGETVDCSCTQHPRPVAKPPVTKATETVDCSCSKPKPKPTVKLDETVDCACSQHPRPTAKPPVTKATETVDCSCQKPPRPTKPVVKEEVCPYAEVEEIINGLAEKITLLKNKLETVSDKEKVKIINKDLDAIADALEIISNSDLTPEQAKEKLLEIKNIIEQIETYINNL